MVYLVIDNSDSDSRSVKEVSRVKVNPVKDSSVQDGLLTRTGDASGFLPITDGGDGDAVAGSSLKLLRHGPGAAKLRNDALSRAHAENVRMFRTNVNRTFRMDERAPNGHYLSMVPAFKKLKLLMREHRITFSAAAKATRLSRGGLQYYVATNKELPVDTPPERPYYPDATLPNDTAWSKALQDLLIDRGVPRNQVDALFGILPGDIGELTIAVVRLQNDLDELHQQMTRLRDDIDVILSPPAKRAAP